MTTVGELVDKADIPDERKDDVKTVLHDLGYEATRVVGKAFLKIAKSDMTDAGMSIADANAILAEVEPLQGRMHHFTAFRAVLCYSVCSSFTCRLSANSNAQYFSP